MYKKDVLKKHSPSNIYSSNNAVDWETFDLRALIQNFQTVECFDTYFEKYISILENNFFSGETLHFNLFFFNLSSFIYHDLPYTYKKKILKIVVFSLLTSEENEIQFFINKYPVFLEEIKIIDLEETFLLNQIISEIKKI